MEAEKVEQPPPRGQRVKLPRERSGITHKFTIHHFELTPSGGKPVDVEGYITVNTYEDGRVGEVFVRIGKAGDSLALLDEWSKAFSLLLQLGLPLADACEPFLHTRYGVSGRTQTPDVRMCTSLTDYVCRWLLHKFGGTQ